MPAAKGITIAHLKAALRKHAGVYVLAARELGCDRANVKQRVDNTPELQAWVDEIEQEVLDAAEAVIKNKIVKGDDKTARWYLQMKGKGRGFSTRHEHTGADGAPLPAAPGVNVTITYSDAGSKDDVV